jgi:hypothetical protein
MTDPDRQEKFLALAAYLLAGGITEQAIVTRLERLKFEQITTGRTASEVIADETAEGSAP